MNIPAAERVFLNISVWISDADGSSITVPGVDVAVVPSHTSPASDTVWSETTWTEPTARFLAAGPVADSTDAVVLSTGDLWIRVTDPPQVIVSKVSAIKIV